MWDEGGGEVTGGRRGGDVCTRGEREAGGSCFWEPRGELRLPSNLMTTKELSVRVVLFVDSI